jgi:hypothetical protein
VEGVRRRIKCSEWKESSTRVDWKKAKLGTNYVNFGVQRSSDMVFVALLGLVNDYVDQRLYAVFVYFQTDNGPTEDCIFPVVTSHRIFVPKS